MITTETLSSMRDYIIANKDKPHKSKNKIINTDWTGVASYEEAWEIFLYGANTLADSIRSKVETYTKGGYTKGGYIPAVQGDFFDVGLVVAGVPEAYFNRIDEVQEAKQLEILVQINYRGVIDSSSILDNASILIGKIKAIEAQGIQTRLVFISKGDLPNKQYLETRIVVKDYKDSINYLKISSLLHPCFLRVILFAWRGLQYPNLARVGCSVGHSKYSLGDRGSLLSLGEDK